MFSNSIHPRFDITTLESLEETFAKAKEEMTEWEWNRGGYLALYLSQKRKFESEPETIKNKRAKR